MQQEQRTKEKAGKEMHPRRTRPATAKHNEIIITNIALKIINNKKRYLVIAF